MMLRSLLAPSLLALSAFAWTALLLGITDAAALASGGDDGRRLLAGAFVLVASGLGSLRPRAAGRDAWFALLWLAAAGLLLPALAPNFAGPTAGTARSPSSAFALLWLAIALGWPLARIGGLLAARVEATGPAAWNALLLGSATGWLAVTDFGLGPRSWIVVVLLLGLSARVALPPLPAGSYPVRWHELAAPALLSASLCFGLLFLLPHLELFDGSSAAEDGTRWLTLAIPLCLAALTLGSAFSESRAAGFGAALLGALLAAGWGAAGRWIDHFSQPAAFARYLDTTLPRRLLGGGERLAEGQALYVVAVTVPAAWFALLAAGAALRSALPGHPGKAYAGRALAAVLLAAGISLGGAVFGHPEWTPLRAPIAAVLALAAALAALASGSWPRQLRLRLALAGAMVAAAVLFAWPRLPNAGAPSPDNFDYTVRAQALGVRSIARVLERSGGPTASRWQLADGRNVLTLEPEPEQARRMEAVFAAALTAVPARSMLVGTPHPGTVSEWRRAGAREIVLVTDPPELATLARVALPGWTKNEPDQVHASVGSADGRFDLILLRDETPWDERRGVLQPSLIASCARRLAAHGVMVLALDPERCLPGTVEAAYGLLRDHCAATALWILPRGLHTPRLLLAGTRAAAFAARPGESAGVALRSYGLPLEDEASRDLLLLTAGSLDAASSLPLAAPRARSLGLLSQVTYRRLEGVQPRQRAGLVLEQLERELGSGARSTLLPFLRLHLSAQQRSVEDDYYLSSLTTPAADWVDVAESALDELLALTRRQPCALLRALWAEIGPFLLHKREIEWVQRYYGALLEEARLFDPRFELFLAAAALEALDPEAALAHAERASAARADSREALFLRARSLAALGRHAEAVDAYRPLAEIESARWNETLPVPRAQVLRGYAESLLAAGERGQAEEWARRLEAEFGAEALGKELESLLGIEHEEPHLVHPEGDENAPR